MEYITLDCFENFKCTNKNCSDSCCIGWEIYIDHDTFCFYKSLEGSFGDIIRRNITDTEPSEFITDENRRCPFLNEEGLCNIILNLGEDKIPYICKNHPRFYNGDEMGMGIACEEAAGLVLTSEKGIELTGNKEDTVIKKIRSKCMAILKNKNKAFPDRLIEFLDFACEADDLFIFGEEEESDLLCKEYEYEKKEWDKKDYREEYIEFFSTLESVGERWDAFLTLIKETKNLKKEEFLSQIKWYKYENLAVYYLFRYLVKAEEDGDLLTKVKLVVISVLFQLMADMCLYTLTGEDNTLKNAVLYSRELEYSEENIELLYEESENNNAFSYEALCEFINSFNNPY